MAKKQNISLENFKEPNKTAVLTKDRKYNVVLYWGHKKYFTNKKEVLNYLAASSRMLNDRYNELNILLADCFRAYRLAWPYIEAKPTKEWFNNNFSNVARQMDHSLNNFGIQGNFNAFDKFYKAVAFLLEILNKLELIEKRRLNVWPAEIRQQKTRLVNCRVSVDQFLAT